MQRMRSDKPMTSGMSCSMITIVSDSSVRSLTKQLPERLRLSLCDPGGRLVEQQDLRLQRDQARDLGDPSGSGRQLPDRARPEARQTHPVEQLVGLFKLAPLAGRDAERAERDRGRRGPFERDRHTLRDRERREQRGVLEGANPRIHPRARLGPYVA